MDWSSGTHAFATRANGWGPHYAQVGDMRASSNLKRILDTHVIGQPYKLPLCTGVGIQVITTSTTGILAHKTDVLLRCVRGTVEDLPPCGGRNVRNRVRRAPLDEQEISWVFKGGE
jgi:hypothetical protein